MALEKATVAGNNDWCEESALNVKEVNSLIRPSGTFSPREKGRTVVFSSMINGTNELGASVRSGVMMVVGTLVILGGAATALRADSGPYCGIYAVYGAAAAVGVKADFERLLDAKYVSSRSGSTIADLMNAASEIGVHATPLSGMGVASLNGAQEPLILHVKSFGQVTTYNHWVLFLGMLDGKARIVDSGGGVFLMDVAELLARWDGVGLAISRNVEPQTKFAALEIFSLATWGLIVLCGLAVSAIALRRMLPDRKAKSTAWAFTIPILTALLCVVRGQSADLNLWRNSDCVQFILAAEGHNEIPVVTTAEVEAMIKTQKDLLIFDNRYDRDMKYSHLPGARPLPVDLPQHRIAEELESLDRTRPVLMYCQSDGCRFSDQMAVVLIGFGFEDVRIYRDGWAGWKAAHSKPTSSE